jgi:hypothetical protein
MKILAIDPGLKGALCFIGPKEISFYEMPLTKNQDVDFDLIDNILCVNAPEHIFLERAVSFGMGTKGAFNYGRAFAALEIAIMLSETPFTFIEPSKWTKEMHAGIDADLKAKAKSVIAVERLFKKHLHLIPKTKKGLYHDGCVDALLMASYGQRLLARGE